MPKNKEKKIQNEWKFARNLNESRRKINLNSSVGKNLDKHLFPLYKKYGFYDSSRLLTDMDLTKISDKENAFFDKTPQSIMQDLDIDINYYNNLNDLPMNLATELSNRYTRATEALRNVRKKLCFEKYSSGNYAWDIYGILHWVTDFNDLLNKIKLEQYESIREKKKEITENLQKLIYHSPQELNTNIDNIAKQFNTHRYNVIESFKEIVGIVPEEYTKMLEEALGDFSKHQAGYLKNKLIGKFGIGQSKAIAQAKTKASEDMNTILTKWNQTVLGDPKAATPAALRAFLINTLKVTPQTVSSVMKRYKNNLIKENVNLKEDYLPAKYLRNFFLDVVNSQRAAVLKLARDKAARNAARSTAAATVMPSKPVAQPIIGPKVQSGTGVQMAAPATKTQTTKTADIDTIENTLKALPANLRAQAILRTLPSLGDAEIKDILNSLLSKK